MARHAIIWGAVFVLLAAPASAAFIGDVQQWPVEIEALVLNPDGEWLEGRDWGYDQASMWMLESWQGHLGSTVWFLVEVDMGLDPASTVIDVDKSLTNGTDYHWDSFEIQLFPHAGATLEVTQAQPNPEFPEVGFMPFGGEGGWRIAWDQGEDGTGVPIGAPVTLMFQFVVDGPLAFDLVQTALPEPASVMLVSLGGWFLVRRRR